MFHVIINVKLISKEIFMTEVLILLPSRKTSLLIKMFTEKKITKDIHKTCICISNHFFQLFSLYEKKNV